MSMRNFMIYILDENPTEGNFLKYHLSINGFTRSMVFHVSEELSYALQKKPVPDFIILRTPLADHMESALLKTIKRVKATANIIILSSVEDHSHAKLLLDSGATDYIVWNGIRSESLRELVANLYYIIREEIRVS
jgi:DNA-binding response OmpR family regulator